MILKDVVNVTGRGTILVCDIENDHISLNDYVIIDSKEYPVRGIEMISWNNNTVGLLIPRQDDIETIKNKTFDIRHGVDKR